MLSYLSYLGFIFALVYWIQKPAGSTFNSLIPRPHPAQELEEWLKKFHWGARSELGPKLELPQYKFYTEVVELLLNLARKLGGNYQDSLLFLREGLQSDRQFEKKLSEIILGCWLQMAIMMVLTWSFIFGSLSMVEVNVSGVKLLFIFIWQLIGLGCLPLLLRYLRQRLFGDIGKIWRMLYVLNSLARIPLARSENLTHARISELKEVRQVHLKHLVEKLTEVCKRSLQMGGNYEEEVRALMHELRFQEKWHFELFEKRLMVIKLGLLSLFFLPSYLAFVFLLLGDLLELL